jgi:hypothetical protein
VGLWSGKVGRIPSRSLLEVILNKENSILVGVKNERVSLTPINSLKYFLGVVNIIIENEGLMEKYQKGALEGNCQWVTVGV